MTFPKKFDRSKVFFHFMKLGNTQADARIVIELYDVTSMTEDLRRWVSLWLLTKTDAGLFVLEVRSILVE